MNVARSLATKYNTVSPLSTIRLGTNLTVFPCGLACGCMISPVLGPVVTVPYNPYVNHMCA